MLINKKAVRELALTQAHNGRDRVGVSFFSAIEAAVREAISRRVDHHDNKRGRRRRPC
tara:strand:+ start:333 stop:506 length:174 start_codon:yes stop_codon:yes gene_type:complete